MNRPFHHWCGNLIKCEECYRWDEIERAPKNMEYAESLGLTLFCGTCELMAIAVWDHEQKVWVDEEDNPLPGHFVPCHQCTTIHRLPSVDETERWIKAQSGEET